MIYSARRHWPSARNLAVPLFIVHGPLSPRALVNPPRAFRKMRKVRGARGFWVRVPAQSRTINNISADGNPDKLPGSRAVLAGCDPSLEPKNIYGSSAEVGNFPIFPGFLTRICACGKCAFLRTLRDLQSQIGIFRFADFRQHTDDYFDD